MYTKLTLADCLQSLADRTTSGIVPVKAATLTLWARLLNRGQEYCTRRLGGYKQVTLSTVSGTIALPTDFKTIFRVFQGTTELNQIGADDNDKQVGFSFWISGNFYDGFYLNIPSDMTLSVEYYYFPAPMVNNSDICIISDIEAPVAYAYAMLRKSQSDPFEDSDKALQECDSRLTEMKSDMMANNGNIDFTILNGA